jgi:2-dehydropantoate 2-reductase
MADARFDRGHHLPMRGNIGEVEAVSGGREFVSGVIDEAVAIISAVGVPPSREAVDTVRAQLAQRGSTHTSSMYRDLQKGHRVEADRLSATWCGAAAKPV